jgi:hypothetical protein
MPTALILAVYLVVVSGICMLVDFPRRRFFTAGERTASDYDFVVDNAI